MRPDPTGARPAKLLGLVFTVRTRPGDNLIVHGALDMLQPGDALTIDAGGETTNAMETQTGGNAWPRGSTAAVDGTQKWEASASEFW